MCIRDRQGAVVRLLDAQGNLIEATTTNPNGYYSFINLTPDTDYIIEFVKPTGTSFTTQDATNDTSNSRDGDLTDSDADLATGRVLFNSGPAGNNDPGGPTIANNVTDNPGLDAGLVTPMLNLELAKSAGTYTGLLVPGTEVTWKLTPKNSGSTTAAAGWTVTEVLPAGLELNWRWSPTDTSTSSSGSDPASPATPGSIRICTGSTGASLMPSWPCSPQQASPPTPIPLPLTCSASL